MNELVVDLERESGITVSASTVGRHLKGKFSLKCIRRFPETMNSNTNKLKRKDYCEQVRFYTNKEDFNVWIDETNVNLFLGRKFGR